MYPMLVIGHFMWNFNFDFEQTPFTIYSYRTVKRRGFRNPFIKYSIFDTEDYKSMFHYWWKFK